MDTIEYIKNVDGTFTKIVTQPEVVNVKEETQALEAQVADMLAGTSDTQEEQAKIDAAILNYEEALLTLKK